MEQYRNCLIAIACILDGEELKRLFGFANKMLVRTSSEGQPNPNEVLREVERLCLPTKDKLDDDSKLIRAIGEMLKNGDKKLLVGELDNKRKNTSSLLGWEYVSESDTEKGRNVNDNAESNTITK